jgi:hypothetical protein
MFSSLTSGESPRIRMMNNPMIQGKNISVERAITLIPNRVAMITGSIKIIRIDCKGVSGIICVVKKSPISLSNKEARKKNMIKTKAKLCSLTTYLKWTHSILPRSCSENLLLISCGNHINGREIITPCIAAIHAFCFALTANPEGATKIELPMINKITNKVNWKVFIFQFSTMLITIS